MFAAAAFSSASALSSQLSSAPTNSQLSSALTSSQLSSQLLRRVRRNDVAGSAAADTARPFLVGGEEYGRVLPQAAAVLAQYGGPYLHVTDESVYLDDAACAAAEAARSAPARCTACAEPPNFDCTARTPVKYDRLRLSAATTACKCLCCADSGCGGYPSCGGSSEQQIDARRKRAALGQR